LSWDYLLSRVERINGKGLSLNSAKILYFKICQLIQEKSYVALDVFSIARERSMKILLMDLLCPLVGERRVKKFPGGVRPMLDWRIIINGNGRFTVIGTELFFIQ
jgi:hypothetical protein